MVTTWTNPSEFLHLKLPVFNPKVNHATRAFSVGPMSLNFDFDELMSLLKDQILKKNK